MTLKRQGIAWIGVTTGAVALRVGLALEDGPLPGAFAERAGRGISGNGYEGERIVTME